MKRNKILIPTLSALAVTPAIALSACNQGDSVEQQILDCVFKPIDLTETVKMPKSTFLASYDSMTEDERKAELIFDLFGDFNQPFSDGTEQFTIRDLYLNKHEGAFKVNVAVCETSKKDSNRFASFRGYISYVFGKQHKVNIDDITYTFNANDFMMITFDFTDAWINKTSWDGDLAYSIDVQYGDTLGNIKFKFESGEKEALFNVNHVYTSQWVTGPKNSKNWVK